MKRTHLPPDIQATYSAESPGLMLTNSKKLDFPLDVSSATKGARALLPSVASLGVQRLLASVCGDGNREGGCHGLIVKQGAHALAKGMAKDIIG